MAFEIQRRKGQTSCNKRNAGQNQPGVPTVNKGKRIPQRLT